ncbi:MAG: AGE family epimerase/isomerase [Prevotella sp.]|nr:AGE family epimerase/isomerase [Prevotella sp.]
MDELKRQMRQTLENNILNYWIERVTDKENGGYYGRVDGHDRVDATADKGAVLNARILWAFSAAYRVLHNPAYLVAAMRAKDYLLEHFLDREQGGVYWSLDYKGCPVDTKKQTYAIGFAIYGLSEFARATGDSEALRVAIGLFHDIEHHAFDRENNGYIEALTRSWQPIADMRLSDKDENGSRTMNTHLHVIEPYTNLLRVLKARTDLGLSLDGEDLAAVEKEVEMAVRNLLDIFTGKLLNRQTWHLDLFFNDRWEGKRNIQSFGHDIEASWLLHETALVLGDDEVLKRLSPVIRHIAAAADEGLQPDGGMIYERWTDSGATDGQRQWWVLCESVIGHANLYEHFGDAKALGDAIRAWKFIQANLLDKEQGEWHWAVLADGSIDRENDKAGFWKCPYHNSRMCLEMIERDI